MRPSHEPLHPWKGCWECRARDAPAASRAKSPATDLAEATSASARSQRAHRSPDHRDIFERCVAVLRLPPRAVESNDHLLGRIDEDELAEDTIRRKGTVVDAAGHGRRRPPVIAVS